MTLTQPKREHEEEPPHSAKFRKSRPTQNPKRSNSDSDANMPPIHGSHNHQDDEKKGSGSGSPLLPNRTRGPGQPLRRGDACLMCRAKKLRCSAHKPVCDQCAKRKDRCVYDVLRPASRVEKLERKLAEMDEQDFREALARRAAQGLRLSFDNGNTPLTAPMTSTIGQDNGIPDFAGSNLFGFQSHSPHLPMQTSATNSPNGSNSESEQLVDINDIPSALWSWPVSASSVVQGHHSAPPFVSGDHHLQLQHQNGNLPWTLPASSTNILANPTGSPLINGFYDMSFPSTASTSASSSRSQSYDSTACPTPPQFFNNISPIPGLDGLNINLANVPPPSSSYNWIAAHPAPARLPNLSELNGQVFPDTNSGMNGVNNLTWSTALPVTTSADVVNSVMQVKKEMDAEEKIMKARELTEGARNYLLDLFFCPNPPRQIYGSELFTYEEFKERLALPEGQRPHPCLLFSMYTIASSGSYVPSIRKLSEPLFRIAVSKLEIAIRKKDRLIDAINASKNLSKWLFTRARVLEGYQFSCKAISLCVACGLHRIPSSIFRPEDYLTHYRMPMYILEPPKNQWELAQRIHAFWSVWGNERGGSITHAWSSAIRDEDIITPLPRSREDYTTNALFNEPDITLKDLYDLPHRPMVTHLKSIYCYILLSCHLLHRSMDLPSRTPETTVSSYRSLGLSSNTAQSGRSAPRDDYPVAYKEINETSIWLENNIPLDWKMQFLDGPSWTEPDIPVIALLLKTARMHLHPIESEVDRPIGLSIALECSSLTKSLILYYAKLHKLADQSTNTPSPSDTISISPINNGYLNQENVEDTNSITPKTIEDSTSTFDSINRQPPSNDKCARNKVGISGPYCLSASYWVVERFVSGSKILEGLENYEEARKCKSEAEDILRICKELELDTHCNVVAEHVKKIERLLRN